MIKSIKKWASDVLNELTLIRKELEKLSSCVKSHHHGHGDTNSLSTKHWND